MTRCPEGREDDKVALLKSLTEAELMAYVDGVLDAHGVGEQETLGEWYPDRSPSDKSWHPNQRKSILAIGEAAFE